MTKDSRINGPEIKAVAVTSSLISWDKAQIVFDEIQNVTPEMFAKYETRMSGKITLQGTPTPCEFAPGTPSDTEAWDGVPSDTEVCKRCYGTGWKHGSGWGRDDGNENCSDCDGFGATFIYGDDLK